MGLAEVSTAAGTAEASDKPEFVKAKCDVTIVEFLNVDPRPTFVLDLYPESQSRARHPAIAFGNPSLVNDVVLHDIIKSTFSEGARLNRIENEFSLRATQPEPHTDEETSSSYINHVWTVITIRSRWRVISGSPTAAAKYFTRLTHLSDGRSERSDVAPRTPAKSSPWEEKTAEAAWGDNPLILPPSPPNHTSQVDWTYSLTRNGITPHLEVFLSVEWSKTEMGPLDTWSPQLQLLTYLVMIDLNPAIILWGNSMVLIYNEAFVPIVGPTKYPECFGQTLERTFPEILADPELKRFQDGIFARGRLTGQTTRLENQKYFLMHNGGLEERYFTYSYFPVQNELGTVVGFYEPCVESTKDVLSKRRHETLRQVGALTENQTQLSEFWINFLRGMEGNDCDIPYALAYSVQDKVLDTVEPLENDGLVFEHSLGLDLQDDGKPLSHRLLMESPAFMEATRCIRRSHESNVFKIEHQDLVDALFTTERGFGDPPRQFLICAVGSTMDVHGVIVLGMNSRRKFDSPYQRFIQLLMERAALSLTSIMFMTEHTRAVQAAAARESRFKTMIELSPVGEFMMRDSGQMIFVNQSWKTITGYEYDEHTPMSWVSVVHEDDMEIMQREFHKVSVLKEAVNVEIRMKKPFEVEDPNTGKIEKHESWALAAALVHQDEEGQWIVMGSLTDISRQKYNESLERTRTQDAIERKRQQENFIDMTSHEIRNPLSAIFQCTEMILSSLSAVCESISYHALTDLAPSDQVNAILASWSDEINSSLENARTISLCSQHQKRIVDDVLTLSKLDSALLKLAPVSVEPKVVTRHALEMFAAEFISADVEMEFVMESSYQDLDVEFMYLDSNRLVQVLINLIGNALKFTKNEDIRKITVSLGATKVRPKSANPTPTSTVDEPEEWEKTSVVLTTELPEGSFAYYPPSGNHGDPTLLSEWGTGEQLYLTFKVQDTGCGISDADLKLIFERFAQGNPRTHITYGGSGLGLHIARELSEMQGGGIGVTSKHGSGSTFAFYIKARRSPPDDRYSTPIGAIRTDRRPSRLLIEAGKHSPVNNCSSNNNHVAEEIVTKHLTTSDLASRMYNVLIVEDNLVNQRVLRKQLERLGWTVTIANHGIEALEYLKGTQWWGEMCAEPVDLDVVLMDIEMPIMDGLTCVKEIRRLQQAKAVLGHVPVIAVSANARVEQIRSATWAGMDDVVSKPFRIHELVAKVALHSKGP